MAANAMWHPRTFPDFLVIHEFGETSLFRDLLGDLNVILLARYREPFHGLARDSLLRLVAENGDGHGAEVRGFEIRTAEVACPVHQTCQVGSRQLGGRVEALCGAAGAVSSVCGVASGDRIFVIDRHGLVTDSGTPQEVERMSLQLALDAALLMSGTERGPPALRKHCA